jgi:hypothetical protein
VLEEIAARARVRWQVVSVDSQDVVLVAVDRAEVLIRVYEKPNLVCYLRIGDQTVPIDDTLFADLALGRRAKPDLEFGTLSAHGGVDSSGYYVIASVVVHNRGLVWVPDIKVACVGYMRGPHPAPESMRRYLDVRPTTPPHEGIAATVRDLNPGADAKNGPELRPFEQTQFAIKLNGLPASEERVPWAWAGAIVAVPSQGPPSWAQLAFTGLGHQPPTCHGWVPRPGIAPVVAFAWSRETPSDLVTIFGDALPPAVRALQDARSRSPVHAGRGS